MLQKRLEEGRDRLQQFRPVGKLGFSEGGEAVKRCTVDWKAWWPKGTTAAVGYAFGFCGACCSSFRIRRSTRFEDPESEGPTRP